jgi:hypothetical protein
LSSSLLHILNGDSTKALFSKSNIRGDTVVWREVLVQGPLFYSLDTELFWEMRSQFLEKGYGAKLASYRRKVILEFQKIRQFQGDEIVLWFEYDLFCQVNLIALLSYFLRSKKGMTISLVCVGDFPGYSKRVGLGELPHTVYRGLFDNRQKLEKEDLIVADKAWMYFCGKDSKKLKTIQSEKLEYLSDAMLSATKTFRESNHLSPLERHILKVINDNHFDEKELIKYLLENDTEFGFGDRQYEYMIHKLSDYIVILDSKFHFHPKGKDFFN